MKKLFLTSFLFFFTGLSLVLAQKKELKLEDYLNRDIYPERMNNLQWVADNDAVSYIENNKLVLHDLKKDNTDTILSVDDFSNNPELSELKRFPQISWESDNLFSFKQKNKIFRFSISGKKAELLNQYDEDAEKTDIHSSTKNVAYTIGQNLFVSVDGEKIQVTNDSVEGIVNGAAVHRREFGISKGTFWSNTGRYLAYYHMDESMVTNYPLVNTSARVAEVENTRYPMAGMISHQVRVAVFDTETQTTVYLDTQGEKDAYLTNITWGPEDKFIYVAELNRDQNHMHLNQFDARTGKFTKTLFEEQNERYVEPENPLYFIPGEPDEFLWLSERDGFQHLYHYNTEGKLLKQLTKGNWLVQGVVDFIRDGKEVVFYATKNSPLNQDVFKLQIKNGKITQVTEKEGTHYVKVNQDGDFIDTYTSLNMGREYAVISKKGKTMLTLLTDKDPMEEYNLGEIEVSSLTAEDGTELYYRLIKPADFDPTKKYPVFVYVYGGPHAQLVSNSYQGGAGLFLNYMASQGYVVFTLDNRGSADRGFEFESVIHRNLGDIEVQDQMEGIKFLKSLHYVDTTRIGVDGWSYGGFMTISMKLDYPGTFKVACAGGPVIDWKYYEVMYGERYMDTPQDNPEGYEKSSLLNKVDQLEGRLMIIHGTNDPTVVWQNSQQFVKKCVEQGKLLDYFIYPGHGHNVRGKDRVHLFKKIEQYFKTHL